MPFYNIPCPDVMNFEVEADNGPARVNSFIITEERKPEAEGYLKKERRAEIELTQTQLTKLFYYLDNRAIIRLLEDVKDMTGKQRQKHLLQFLKTAKNTYLETSFAKINEVKRKPKRDPFNNDRVIITIKGEQFYIIDIERRFFRSPSELNTLTLICESANDNG